MSLTLSLTVCRRPEYTLQTILAIGNCINIEKYDVAVFVDFECEQTLAVVNDCRLPAWQVFVSEHRLGCNASVRRALAWGFARSDYHIHLEDDTVPAKDFLQFMEWGRSFGGDESVFSVSGYSRSNGTPNGSERRHWFYPWGWATWANRWKEIDAAWQLGSDVSWDTTVNRDIRNGRTEIGPALSRIQNIGRDGGAHVTADVWEREHYTPHFSGVVSYGIKEWQMPGVS